MKPKIKEILFDPFAVICICVGFSIHSWPSLCFLLVGIICGAFALYYTLLNHRVHGVTESQTRNWGLLFCAVFFIGAIEYWRECKQPMNAAEMKLGEEIKNSATNTPPAKIEIQNMISIEPGESLDPKKPFQTKFIIQNIGNYEITNIGGLFLSAPNVPFQATEFVTNSWHKVLFYMWNCGTFSVPDELKPGAKFAVNLRFFQGVAVSGQPMPDKPITTVSGELVGTNAILLQIVCSYKSLFLPEKKQETFKFYAEPDMEENFHWFQLGYGDPWIATNVPIIPE